MKSKMADSSPATSIIEGTVKFRDGKKWKSRWCVMRKLSPVADCVHLQLYKDLKERHKNGQTKASLSLQQFLGFESGFTLDRESNTLAILCEDVVPVLAFDTREMLMQWRVKVQHNLGSSREFAAVLVSGPAGSAPGPVRLHAAGAKLALAGSRPPQLYAVWHVKLLRRYGMVDKRFCVEGGSRCGKGEGLFIFAMDAGRELAELLHVYSHDVQSRTSMASRAPSVMEKRYSDSSSCMDECFHPSMRCSSPPWPPSSHTMHCLSDLQRDPDQSFETSEDRVRRPTSLPRCTSCIGKISHLTRSSTMGTPGSMISPLWPMENIIEKRSDSDRASIYSRSSGSASDYSRNGLDKSLELKRSSPITSSPTIPAKTGQSCQCWQQPNTCCRKKCHSGPYENYDVPKTPMPLIQEHPQDATDSTPSFYDTPKRIKCVLNDSACCCTEKADTMNDKSDQNDHENHCSELKDSNDVLTNYANITPSAEPIGAYGNYENVDLTMTLEKFENSLQILRSAGFSQEELDALDEIPENAIISPNRNNASQNKGCCNDHSNYMHIEPLEVSSSCNSNRNFSDNVSRISHLSDPTQHSDIDTFSTVRSNSADFTKRHDEDYTNNICFTPTVLRKVGKIERINEDISRTDKEDAKSNKTKKNEGKTENALVARFKDAVKIRRSSSVPSKSDKNRDSSSSNDSGVSTGSLKHHKGDFIDLELTLVKTKKHARSNRQSTDPAELHSELIKSNSSDPLKHLTFHFEEVATMTKSTSCDAETLTRRKKKNAPEAQAQVRHSQATNRSTSSGASDTSDYMESLSVSSMSSIDVGAERHAARPRSGREYASIDRAALAAVCRDA